MAGADIIDKATLAGRFGAGARDYDSVTPVQERMAQCLMKQICGHFSHRRVKRILELGCGTGRVTARLVAAFPDAAITAIDIAPNMIAHARAQHPGPCYLVADAEDFVAQDVSTYDLIVSNATAQWFERPLDTIEKSCGLLKKNGLMAVATFAERTFRELAESFAGAYAHHGLPHGKHLVPMVKVDEWRTRFPEGEITDEEIGVRFPDVMSFLRSIQAAGAVNSLASRSAIPKKVLQAMMQHYTDHYGEQETRQVRATYHACYLFCTS